MLSFQLLIFVSALSLAIVAAGKKRFVFRLDDIQDYYNSQMQIALIDYFMSNNIGVSLGIIGGYFNGADAPLYAKIKDCLKLGNYKCSLFNHGTDAAYIFANAPSVESAKAQVKTCDDRIRALFNNYNTEIMIPHQNSWGPYLIEALTELNYLAISASDMAYSNMTWDLNSKPIRVPQQTTTAGYLGNNKWEAIPITTTLADCVAADSRGEDCVIMMHPNEFADGVYSLDMLRQLVDTLQSTGWTSINFHQIIMEAYGWSETPTARPTAPIYHLDTYLTLQNLPQPDLSNTAKQVLKGSYETVLPTPMVASANMSLIATWQNTTTRQWKVVIHTLVTLPMEGFLGLTGGNETVLYAYTKSLLTTAVSSQTMTKYLRHRSEEYQYLPYHNVTAVAVGFTNIYAPTTSSTASTIFLQALVLAALIVAALLTLYALGFLYHRCCKQTTAMIEDDHHLESSRKPPTRGTGNRSWYCLGNLSWYCRAVAVMCCPCVQTFSVIKDDVSTLDSSIGDVDIIVDMLPCDETNLFGEHSFLAVTNTNSPSTSLCNYHRPPSQSINPSERNIAADSDEMMDMDIEQWTTSPRGKLSSKNPFNAST